MVSGIAAAIAVNVILALYVVLAWNESDKPAGGSGSKLVNGEAARSCVPLATKGSKAE